MAQIGSMHVSNCRVLRIVEQAGSNGKDHWLQVMVDGDHVLTVFGPIGDGTWEVPKVETKGLTQLSIPNTIDPPRHPVVIRVEEEQE